MNDGPRSDGGRSGEPCDDCGEPVSDALARTVRVTVDRAELHSHRLCPDCFAGWVDRYDREMRPASTGEGDSEIIVD
ncbi:DUF7569 family protein [Salinigranum marinum]|uniref:DUF7569 family protein n=1 Tax=Salinigranum marinum TaxID=1515595 RepID=UPI002989FF51|nr:hypothetical protein [Salinigranum marinum]